MVRDQTFAGRDLGVAAVVDDVTLVGRVILQFEEERVETCSDIVIRQSAEFINEDRFRSYINRSGFRISCRAVAVRIKSAECYGCVDRLACIFT